VISWALQWVSRSLIVCYRFSPTPAAYFSPAISPLFTTAMPTCWSGKSLGDDNDHKSHMAYTTNGEVYGLCPTGFPRRLPQVQLFVRIMEYKGGTYQLSDGMDVWHVDFFNG
jgi:hypothetical protein